MHATHTVFWTWREEAWTSVYHRCKEARTTANTLQHVLAMAALLCGVDLPKLRNQERRILRRRSLAIKVFGREEVDRSIGKVQAELKRLGYTGYFHLEVRNASVRAVPGPWELLTLRPSRLSRLKVCDARNALTVLKQATFMLSHAFVALGIMQSPLRPYVAPSRCKPAEWNTGGISPEWLSWCNRWYETSTLRPSTRRSTSYRGSSSLGRWLKINASRGIPTRPVDATACCGICGRLRTASASGQLRR